MRSSSAEFECSTMRLNIIRGIVRCQIFFVKKMSKKGGDK
jgi:hypothetical protein